MENRNKQHVLGFLFCMGIILIGVVSNHVFFADVAEDEAVSKIVLPIPNQVLKWEIMTLKDMNDWRDYPKNDNRRYIQPADLFVSTENGYREVFMIKNDALVSHRKNSGFSIPIIRDSDNFLVEVPADFEFNNISDLYGSQSAGPLMRSVSVNYLGF